MKQASVIIIPVADNFLSLVKNNKFGLIGGTLDFPETPLQCAMRELYEETGLRSDINNLVFIASNYDESGVLSHLYASAVTLLQVPKHNTPEGKLAVATKSQLLSDEARFPIWNKWAFYHYDKWIYYSYV